MWYGNFFCLCSVLNKLRKKNHYLILIPEMISNLLLEIEEQYNTLKNNIGEQNVTVLRKMKWYNRTSGVRLTFPWSWENYSASLSFNFFSVKWNNSTNVQGYWGDLREKTKYKMLGTMPNKCLITTIFIMIIVEEKRIIFIKLD